MTAESRVQDAREAPGRVVPHQQAHVVPAPSERFGLELGVLDHGAPERPGVRNDDSDLHAAIMPPR